MNETNMPDLTEYHRQLDDWANKPPCRLCDDLRDICPICNAELGRIFAVGLAAIGFTRLDDAEPRTLRTERN